PFYQHFHHGLMDRPLHELPVLTKAMMMEHFDDLVTDRSIRFHDIQQYLAKADASTPFLNRYRVIVTSGSTGQPSIFLSDLAEGAAMADTYTRFEVWGGVTPNSKATVVSSASPAHMSARFPLTIDGQQVPLMPLSSLDPIETLVQRLNDWQPDALIAYSSIISILANEQHQGRLHIPLRSIFCGADTLTSDMRRRIEEAWQTKLFNAYATTEGGILATECSSHQGMHLFEDFSILEVVDQDNRPVPPGTLGAKVLLTVLFRHTQPLIRYEVSDLVQMSTQERCPCGSPFALLESIQGRTADMLYLPALNGKEAGMSPLQFETVFDALPISGWQVIQEHDGLHIFLTGASQELRDKHVRDALRQALTTRGVIVPTIVIHRVTTLTQNASGKVSMLISHLPRQA
ncbi:MAG: AMP-binding protein, partial [Ktedonobacteraceae bacterium]